MNAPALNSRELALMSSVFRRHPEILSVLVFGSRAMGSHRTSSDVDLAIKGDVDPLQAESIAAELEELPLPYRFEVHSIDHITHQPLREHIKRVGLIVYPEPS